MVVEKGQGRWGWSLGKQGGVKMGNWGWGSINMGNWGKEGKEGGWGMGGGLTGLCSR